MQYGCGLCNNNHRIILCMIIINYFRAKHFRETVVRAADFEQFVFEQLHSSNLPRFSSLHVQGKVEVRNDINVLTESPDVRFVNMGILFLFNEIRLEVAGDVVDRVRNPRIMSVMKGYVTYNTGQSKALQNGG
jgi:hypothetical protein